MKWRAVPIVAALLVVQAVAADDTENDLKKLEGTWEIIRREAGGKVVKPKGAPDRAVIQGDKVTFFSAGEELTTLRNLRLEIDSR